MLPNLKELNLSNNYLSDEELVHLKPLKRLVFLNLSNNNFKTNSVTNVLPNLTKLEVNFVLNKETYFIKQQL